MFLFKGGHKAEKGVYWNPKDGSRVSVTEGGELPGGLRESYLKLPESLVLLIVPLIGLVMAFSFPFGVGVVLFIVLLAFLGAIGAAIYGSMILFKEMLGRSTSFGWSPAESYLSGRKGRAKKEEKGPEAEDKD